MYDVIIAGARCAGSPLAMLLARRGHRVLVVDRSTFPSDIMSTHFIVPPGVMKLEAWGLLDDVIAAGTPPIPKMTMRLEDLAMSPPREPGIPDPICPRRTVLDKILVDAARAAGAEVREGVTVDELTFEDGAVTGIRAHSKGGGRFDEQARIVVGADGIHSLVARQVTAPAYDEHPALTCGYYAYWEGLDTDGAQLSLNGKTGLLAFPTNDNLTCLAVMRPIADFDDFRTHIDERFRAYAAENLPAIGEQLPGARQAERYIGTAETYNYFRKPYGPGWALVGDAGYHRDPVTGLGISDAFRDAELLAEAIDAGLSGGAPMDEAMAGYEQQRNTAAKPDYERTIFTAGLPSKEEMLAAMAANAPDAAAAAAAQP